VTERNREIRQVTRQEYLPYLLNIHYAARVPSISYSYGLFVCGILEGVVTYGTPASSPLRSGICGAEMSGSILELNRLCLRSNEKNDASWLVAASLKILPKEKIIVSFADTAQGHEGIVYQASNFWYTGLSAKRTDWKLKGKEHLHGQTVADEFRGRENRAQLMREKYGSDFYLEPRSRKHRYILPVGSRKFCRFVRGALLYQVMPYPRAASAALFLQQSGLDNDRRNCIV
jgi:hypothetical protein